MTTETNATPDIAWEDYSDHRTPGISIQKLLQRGGDAHFEFNLTRFAGEEFHAPRHHHNFDQVRIGLAGTTKYGPRERLTARTIGYYPEGCWYGPTTVDEPTVQAILQFDGPGRLGYVNYVAHDAAVAELKTRGEFRDGYYYPEDGERVDGYQAGWEQATGREMVYPQPRFELPLYLNVDAFAWIGEPGAPVRHKTLGVFGERGTGLRMVEIAPGGVASLGGGNRTVVALVLTGSVEVGGDHHGTWGAFYEDGPDPVAVTGGTDGAELVLIDLPVFDGA